MTRYRRALALAPDYINAHINLGAALEQQGKVDEAAAQYRRVVELDPRNALAYNNLGKVLKGLGRMQEGEARFRRALELKPDYPEAHYNLANVLSVHGKLDDAVAHHRCALALARAYRRSHQSRRRTRATRQSGRGGGAIPAGAGARAAERHGSLQSWQWAQKDRLRGGARALQTGACRQAGFRGRVRNNLGAVLAVEQGELDAAREAYQKAVEAGPTRAAYHRNLAALKRIPTRRPTDCSNGATDPKPSSVPERSELICNSRWPKPMRTLSSTSDHSVTCLRATSSSACRSVTTRRPQQTICSASGPSSMPSCCRQRRAAASPRRRLCSSSACRDGHHPHRTNRRSHPKAVGAGELQFRRHRPQPCWPRRWRAQLPRGSYHDVRRADSCVRSVRAMSLRSERLRQMATRVADKMPYNFHFCGLIHLALPNARIIHARRDPSTPASPASIVHGDGNAFTYDLGDSAASIAPIKSLMAHWRAVLPPGFLLEVHYEEVVGDLEKQARAIVAHCGLKLGRRVSCLSQDPAPSTHIEPRPSA